MITEPMLAIGCRRSQPGLLSHVDGAAVRGERYNPCGPMPRRTFKMRGVQFLVDDQGEKTGVLIDLKKNGELWEDFYDRALAEARASEPRESLDSVKKRIHRRRRSNG